MKNCMLKILTHIHWVSECWRNVEGQWKLIPIEFERGRQADSNGYCKSLAGIFGCYVQASTEEKTA